MTAHRTRVRRGPLTFDVSVTGPETGAPVLLLHGFPQRGDSFDSLVPLLTARGYCTVVPDQRGYSPGARPVGRRAYRMEHLVADAAAVVDEVVGDGPVHVVGHDWGAAVAWAFTLALPHRVRSLTALSVPHPAAFVAAMATGSQALRSWYMYLFQLPGLPERLAASRFAVRWLTTGGQDPVRARRDVARLAEPGAASGPLNYYRAMPLLDPRAARRPVRRPTLFVWSDGDVAITAAAARRCARWVEGAPYEFHTMSGVSHWIPEEAPAALADVLLAHLHRYDQDEQETPAKELS